MLLERIEEELEAIDNLAARMLRQATFDGVPATAVWDLAESVFDGRGVGSAKRAADLIERDDDFQRVHVIDVSFVEKDIYTQSPAWHVTAAVFWRDPPAGGRYLYTIEAHTGRNMGGRAIR